MSQILTSHEFNRRLRVLTVSGEITEAEILNRVQPPAFVESSVLTLWDFSSGSLCFGPNEAGGLEGFQDFAAEVLGRRSKTALVCPNELDHGLFRLLRVFASRLHYPREIRTFRNMKAARRWLGACRLCVQQISLEEALAKPCLRTCSRLGQLQKIKMQP
jgi:hypothetical protein